MIATDETRRLREKLRLDEEQAKAERGLAWLEPERWSQYVGREGRAVYQSFSDQELLDILRRAAEELGHLPSQKEVFCVHRDYIRRRFKNWPTALRAAGLRPPKEAKEKKRTEEVRVCAWTDGTTRSDA